jgi:dodecin
LTVLHAPPENSGRASEPSAQRRDTEEAHAAVEEDAMTEAVARVTKITAASTKSFQDAVDAGLKRAAKTVRGITGLEVIEQKAKVEDNRISEYRATIEITFILE